jgi:integrase
MAGLRDGVIRRGTTWSYVIRVTDARGVSHPRWVGGFPTEQAAKKARDAARVSASRGQFVDRSNVTVERYLTDWLEAHALEVKPKTHEGYRYLLTKYVVPHIGRQRIQSLRPTTISAMYRTLLAEGGVDGSPLSTRTVEYVHAVLRKAFNDAVTTEQLLPSNPVERAKRPRHDSRPRRESIWTADELRTFLDAASAHRLFAYYRLAAYTGARRGELLNLRWEDVRLDAPASIRIRGTVSVVAGRRVEGTTKSGRERTVSIDAETAEVLRRHRKAQDEDLDIAGDSWVVGSHVFRMQIGAQLYPDTVSALMAKLIAGHNAEHPDNRLRPIRFHDLRHTHATLLLRAGVPVHVVAARLGHREPSITLRVYAHVLDDQATGAAEVFAQAMDPDAEGPSEGSK